ncbi:MAG: NAD(P)-dependent oxidoreductase, partial [Acidimicrobiales bacterium]
MSGTRAPASARQSWPLKPPRLLVAPERQDFAVDAITQGGGLVVDDGDHADGLVWLAWRPASLRATLLGQPGVRWVQLPMAGVERVVETGIMADPELASITWTCAKGSYARPVAEHALALALAGLRQLPRRARALSWGEPAGTSLYGAQVTVLGGGGITAELLKLLGPWGVQATVVRRQARPVPGAARTVTAAELRAALPGALVVFVALALSPETLHIVGGEELSLMGARSCLVNVGRGRHVDTDALVEALRAERIGGAALDVTEPEPLPDGHPLWALPNCL